MDQPEQFLSVEKEIDLSTWMPVPTQWPAPGAESMFPTMPEWADYAANAIWNESTLQPRPGELDLLIRVLAYGAEHFPSAYPGFDLFLHLPGPRDMPLPVFIGDFDTSDIVTDEDAAIELRQWTSDDPNAVEPPIIEDFLSPHLGPGVRALRYSVPDKESGEILAGLRYGWHVPHLSRHAYLITGTHDPGHLIATMEDIDALARCMEYVTD